MARADHVDDAVLEQRFGTLDTSSRVAVGSADRTEALRRDAEEPLVDTSRRLDELEVDDVRGRDRDTRDHAGDRALVLNRLKRGNRTLPVVNMTGMSEPYWMEVRPFALETALHWLDTYRFDGLRLDAVHAVAAHFAHRRTATMRSGSSEPAIVTSTAIR